MTMATTVAAVRRILQDDPPRDKIAVAMSDTTTKTFTPTDVSLYQKGQRVEWDDGSTTSAEQALVTSVDTATPLITVMDRGMYGSTAATHLISTHVLFGPRFPYDEVVQVVNTTLEQDLFGEGLYEIVEHQITSTPATTKVFNAPSTSCERFLRIYYRYNTTEEFKDITHYDRDLQNVDTTLYSNGRYVTIFDQPIDGTIMYVNCAHKLAITTLSSASQRIVEWLTCARLLEQTEPRRTAGPTSQSDRTVKPGAGIGTAAYYRQLAEEAMAKESAYLRRLNPRRRQFIR